ncbi:hypothetical protein BMY_1194 [Wohlfahrtiimonas chitiniclastica]|nr:hypothetical protein BMY_1194 [Wohlfahrtiimonas chitiniclastica]
MQDWHNTILIQLFFVRIFYPLHQSNMHKKRAALPLFESCHQL